MREMGVSSEGIKIMLPKATLRNIYLEKIPSLAANILKQEILSLGGECALPRVALVTRKSIDAVLMATDYQLEALFKKLRRQPYHLNQIGSSLKETLKNFRKEGFIFKIRKRKLNLRKPLVMGILNVTPDSFSGDGVLKDSGTSTEKITQKVEEMLKAGVDIIDVGGESTRPGSKPISSKEEIKRVTPALKIIRKKAPSIPISIDTYKYEVARVAIKEGASIVNDITALKDKKMAELCARYRTGVILMHMKGKPLTMQRNPHYKNVLAEIFIFLSKAIKKAEAEGIDKESIVIDPGIGFGKRLQDNLKILKHLYEFKSLGKPILIGVSRKSFLGQILKEKDPQKRDNATTSALVISILNGARILRVHQVKEAKEAILITQSIMNS